MPSRRSSNGWSRPCPVTVFTTSVSRPSSIGGWKSLPWKISGCGRSAKVSIIACTIASHIQSRHLAVDVEGLLALGVVVGQRLRALLAVRVRPGSAAWRTTGRTSESRDSRGAPHGSTGIAPPGAGLLVVPRVDVVLDQVVALRVVAVRAAALLVDERVRDRVGADVRHVAEREGEELTEVALTLRPTRRAAAPPGATRAWHIADVLR